MELDDFSRAGKPLIFDAPRGLEVHVGSAFPNFSCSLLESG